jgi:hypothetical protein
MAINQTNPAALMAEPPKTYEELYELFVAYAASLAPLDESDLPYLSEKASEYADDVSDTASGWLNAYWPVNTHEPVINSLKEDRENAP